MILVTDLETAPGYAALSACLDAIARCGSSGEELPLLPDLKPEDLPCMIAGSLRHFSDV